MINKKINNAWRNRSLYAMLLPGLAYLIIFCYIPLYGLIIAFKDYDPFLGIMSSPWVGLKHFTAFLTAPNFWQLIKNTLWLSVYSLLVNFPLPIVLALFINEIRNQRFKKVVQTISYAPYFISTVVVVGICFTILNVDSGVINSILQAIGLEKVYFMSSETAFPTIYVISGLWQTLGWSSIIYVGTLSSVDRSLHEAAELDGAGRLKRIWHINLPAIVPIMMINLLLSIGGLLGIGFEKVYLMQTAGNLGSSEIISTYVYRVTLAASLPQYSFGTAVGLFNSIISIILLSTANFIAKKCNQESFW